MDCKLGLHAKGVLILSVQEDGIASQQFTTLAVWIHTHTNFYMGQLPEEREDMETTLKHFIRELIIL